MYFKNFVVFGINYKECELKEREHFIKNSPLQIIEKLYMENRIDGYIVLSTCLRVEYYLELNKSFTLDILKEEIGSEKIFYKEKEEAISYLFRVVCGFESVIKGEDQILSQIKKAHSLSMENNLSTSDLNVIFNKAIELGKKFRSKSQIAHNALSLEAISLKFIKSRVSDLRDKKILILGLGDLALDILELLKKEEYKSLTITNRSYHKAYEISNIYGANVIGFEDKLNEIVESDIIISATSAPHLVVKKEEIIKNLKKDKEYVFLDLAVPRDIDEKLSEVGNIYLYNIDDVWSVYYNNLENRESLLSKYEYLIEEQLINLNRWASYKERVSL